MRGMEVPADFMADRPLNRPIEYVVFDDFEGDADEGHY
jgi:hypothetical protein